MDLKTRAECLDFIHGFSKSQMLFAAVELGVFEELDKFGPICAADVAKQIGTDKDATERLLNACASIRLLSKDEHGRFVNSDRGKWFVKSTKGSLYGTALLNMKSCYFIAANLSKSVKTGKNCASDVFGIAGDKLYTFGGGYYKDETNTEYFVQAMDGCSFGLAGETLKLIDLSNYKTVCDLGGGSGVFCMALRQMYPEMNILMFDLPEVIEINMKNSELSKAVKFIKGDFFKDELPSADVFMLNHILEDWSEENGKKIVKKIYSALPKGGILLICEYCLPPSKVAEPFAHIVDLNQLASCEGKMRTVDEWEILIKKAAEFSKVEQKGSVSYFGEVMVATK